MMSVIGFRVPKTLERAERVTDPRFGIDELDELVGVDTPFFGEGDETEWDVFGVSKFDPREGVRVMLEFGGDDMVTRSECRSEQNGREIERGGRAGSEDNLVFIFGPDESGDL
jgi:hypothetical protein